MYDVLICFQYNIIYSIGLACRILKVGPTGSKFLGNVQIEVPYVASLKEGQREIIILKCDSVSKNKWVEHHQEEEIIGEPSNDNSTVGGDEDNDTDDVDKMLKVLKMNIYIQGHFTSVLALEFFNLSNF